MTIQAVILAAGMGTRLGRPFPKPLTPLGDGRTIMQQQMENLARVFGDDLRISTVVGFKLDLILEAFPDVNYIYNEAYDQTNTNRSLLKALRLSASGGVLWMNGDVVFDPAVLQAVLPHFERGIELAIDKDRMRVLPVDIGEMFAVEVDFEEDLDRANQHL